jgi:rubredoxin
VRQDRRVFKYEFDSSFFKEERGEKTMQKYVCSVCGYEYDREVGDPDNGIEPGTPFEELPEDWACPVCGAAKEDFEKIDQSID